MCMSFPDSKVHGANMGLIWGRQAPGGPHVGPMNFAIWVVYALKQYDNTKDNIWLNGIFLWRINKAWKKMNIYEQNNYMRYLVALA